MRHGKTAAWPLWDTNPVSVPRPIRAVTQTRMDRRLRAPVDLLPASLEEAERNAERIAALARAGAALVIGLAVAAAILLLPDETRAYLLPRLYTGLVTMAGFLVVAGASYYASKREPFRLGYAYLFVAMDVVLIGVALYAGLALAGHPGRYVFAQPAVWIIPVILAIQAIRFRDGPLIFSAALYVVVLAALLFVATLRAVDPGGGDTLVLLLDTPPGAVRILMLAVASAVLVFAVRNKRDMLARGIGATRREAELNRFLPPEVSRSLDPQTPTAAEQRELAVLFVDLVGFTRAAEQTNPPDIARWLGSYRDRVHTAVRAHGGFIDKFIGDGVMAIFGYETDAPTAARSVMGAIPALAAAIGDWHGSEPQAPKFELAIGGALGPVFVGVIGAGERREFTVIGDAVNVAARLEGIAKERGALAALSGDLVAAAGATSAEIFELGPTELRGRAGAVEVCLVPRPKPAADGSAT